MAHEEHMLSAQQYYELYCKTFACLDTICSIAEEAMRELEEFSCLWRKRFRLLI